MLGEAIKRYRNEKNITQQELAKLIPCSVDSIRRWEANLREPRASDLQRLCEVLGCTKSELLNGPKDGKIKITLSYDWEKFEKGEIDMTGNEFDVFLGKDGEVGIKGAGKMTTREAVEDFLSRVRLQVETAFEAQVKRGAIQPV